VSSPWTPRCTCPTPSPRTRSAFSRSPNRQERQQHRTTDQ
jgi:hypothetical protein